MAAPDARTSLPRYRAYGHYHRWAKSGLDRRLTKWAAQRPRRGDVPLRLVEADCLLECRSRLFGPAREAEDLGEIGNRVCAEIEEVGSGDDRDGFTAESFGLAEVPSAGQELGPHAPPGDVRFGVLGHREALGSPPLGEMESFLLASLHRESIDEQRRDAREIAQLSDALESVAPAAFSLAGLAVGLVELPGVAVESGDWSRVRERLTPGRRG
jgi:hypothetical protein